jgi:hypothetical protein
MQPIVKPSATGELAGINHVAPVLERVIKALNVEIRSLRRGECDDDRRLQAVMAAA